MRVSDPRDDNPVFLVSTKQYEKLEALLSEDPGRANFQEPENSGAYSPLHLAAQTDDVKAVKIILRHGGRVETKDAVGETPLQKARNFASDELIKLLEAELEGPIESRL